MIDKRCRTLADMLAQCPDLHDGAVLLAGGFGDAGVPVLLLEAIAELGLKDLTVVSNNAGQKVKAMNQGQESMVKVRGQVKVEGKW